MIQRRLFWVGFCVGLGCGQRSTASSTLQPCALSWECETRRGLLLFLREEGPLVARLQSKHISLTLPSGLHVVGNGFRDVWPLGEVRRWQMTGWLTAAAG